MGAAGHLGVDQRNAFGRRRFGQSFGGLGMDGAVQGDNGSGSGCFEKTTGSGYDRFGLRVVKDADTDDLGMAGNIRCAVGGVGARFDKRRHGVGRNVVDPRFESGFGQAGGHGGTDKAEADKSNSKRLFLCLTHGFVPCLP
jgi:hypothetical protein